MYVQIVYKNCHDYKPMYWGEEEKVLLAGLVFLDSSALGLSLKIKERTNDGYSSRVDQGWKAWFLYI